MKIIQAQLEHMDVVRVLFREYQLGIDAECCFQGFEEELASLPGDYAPPKGAIYLAYDKAQAIACVAIRPRKNLFEKDAELKRLYVKKGYRRHGIGKDLFNIAMQMIKNKAYEGVVLETLPKQMQAAYSMYHDYGFVPMSNYLTNADEDVSCLRYCFKAND